MILSPEYLESLDPTYRDILRPISEVVEKAQEIRRRFTTVSLQDRKKAFRIIDEILSDLSEKYMLPPQYGSLIWFELRNNYSFQFYQFFVTDDLEYDFEKCHKLLNLDTCKCVEERNDDFSLLAFPNCDLDEILYDFESSSNEPWPKEIYQSYKKSKILYEEINSILPSEDVEKWFEALCKVEDVNFVIHNVEYRLGDDLRDRKLWKLYLRFLEKHDFNLLLHTYSKYCRFFLDDKEMKEEYEKAVKSQGIEKFEVPWMNPFPFEEHNAEIASKLLAQNIERNKPVYVEPWPESPENITVYFDSSDFKIQQNFAFQNSTIMYVLKSSNHILRRRLFKTCKLLFSFCQNPICYRLELLPRKKNAVIVEQESLKIEFDNVSDPSKVFKFKNLHITTLLSLFDHNEFSSSFLSEIIIRRLSKCDAKYIEIYSTQTLSFDELKFLIASGNVMILTLKNVKCLDKKGEEVPMEEILRLTPKAFKIRIGFPKFSSQTAKTLSELPFKNKIKEFDIYAKVDELEPYAFAEFIKKNASLRCDISYRKGNPNFTKILNDAIEDHWNGSNEPQISESQLGR